MVGVGVGLLLPGCCCSATVAAAAALLLLLCWWAIVPIPRRTTIAVQQCPPGVGPHGTGQPAVPIDRRSKELTWTIQPLASIPQAGSAAGHRGRETRNGHGAAAAAGVPPARGAHRPARLLRLRLCAPDAARTGHAWRPGAFQHHNTPPSTPDRAAWPPAASEINARLPASIHRRARRQSLCALMLAHT